MDRLKHMKESLMNAAQSQIDGNLECVDTEELGDVIDMIKDLEEAIYYYTITEAMGEGKEKEKHHAEYRDMDKDYGRMYYNDRGIGSGRGDSYRGSMYPHGQGYGEDYDGTNRHRGAGHDGVGEYRPFVMPEYPQEMLRDKREGVSPLTRKSYMEAKEMHHGKEVQMKELEKYLQELSHDVTEMIQDATPEEKQMLQQKLSLLVTKIK